MRRLRLVLITMSLLALAACAAAPAGGSGQSAQSPASPPASVSAVTAKVKIDSTCRSDADCTVKNVGNCCGEFPACVNVQQPHRSGRRAGRMRPHGPHVGVRLPPDTGLPVRAGPVPGSWR